jgi:hypothetical protein
MAMQSSFNRRSRHPSPTLTRPERTGQRQIPVRDSASWPSTTENVQVAAENGQSDDGSLDPRSLVAARDESVELSSSRLEDSSDKKEEWTCVACTYVNRIRLFLSCEICGQTRKSVQGEEDSDAYCPLNGRLRSLTRDALIAQDVALEYQKGEIQKVHERTLLDERMQEIVEMQQELLAEIERGRHEKNAESRRQRKLSTQQSFRQLEDIFRVEREEQLRLELGAQARKNDQESVKLLPSQRETSFSLENPGDLSESTISSMCSSEELEQQEQLLADWKWHWEAREREMVRIRELLDKS